MAAVSAIDMSKSSYGCSVIHPLKEKCENQRASLTTSKKTLIDCSHGGSRVENHTQELSRDSQRIGFPAPKGLLCKS